MLPEFTPTEHATEVYDELVDSIKKLQSKPRQKLLQKLAAALQNIARQNEPTNQEGGSSSTSEGEGPLQRVVTPEVTTTNNPTSPTALRKARQTHQ